MKNKLLAFTLAVLTIGLLGSCRKINERLDKIDRRIDGIENNSIATINQQIAGINSSIADLGTIRQNIQNLIETTDGQAKDINDLEVADAALSARIDDLKAYVGETLKSYAQSKWVEATFATLEQHKWTCDTIAKIDARIGALDAELSKSIEDCASSLKSWVNTQLEGYYTAAQMDAKVSELLAQLSSASGESQAKADSLAKELTATKKAVETVKVELTEEYQSAIEEAIKTSEGKLSSRISSSISSVNSKVSALADRVDDLEDKVDDLTGRVKALEDRIQSVTIIPAYSDGSVEADEDTGELTINCIISPASAVDGLTSANFKVLLNEVKTKAAAYETLDVSKFDVTDRDAGEVKITADISAHTALDNGKALTAAVKVENGISKFTTDFVGITGAVTVVQTVLSSTGTFTLANNKKVLLIIEPRTENLTLQYEGTSHYPEKLEVRINGGASLSANLSGNLPHTHVDFTQGHINHTSLTTSSSTLAVVTPATIGTLEVKGGNVVIKGATVTAIEVAADAVADTVTKAPVQIVVEKASTESFTAPDVTAKANVVVAPAAGVTVKVTVPEDRKDEVKVAKEGAGTVKDQNEQPITTKAAAKIGDAQYITLADAIAAVKNGETIVMQANEVLTKGQTITLENNEAFTLDLNGKTVSIAETGFDFTANSTNNALRSGVPVRFAIVVNGQGTMNICDNSTGKLGRLETKDNSYGTTKTILVDGNAVVNVNSGTIAADYAPFYVVGYTGTTTAPEDAPKPTLNVKGGTIEGKNYGIVIKGNTGTLVVSGGKVETTGNDGAAISTNGTQDWYNGGGCKISISGGTIKSTKSAALYLPAEANTEITGGVFEGTEGITVKGGSLSISNDAKVSAIGSCGEPGDGNSGAKNTGSAIYIEDTYSGHKPIVNISGGKFSSKNKKVVEYYTTKVGDADDKGKVTLTGGTYSSKPDESYFAPGYAATQNTDGSWTVAIENYWPNFAASSFSNINEGAKTITISSPEELALLAKNINSGTSYAGYTISINGNLDMGAHYWIPINARNGQLSGSTIEGSGNAVISNLKIEKAVYSGNYDYYAGFIAQSVGALTVKDLTFTSAVSVDNGSGVATVLGLTYGNVLFENVKVANSTVAAETKAGALVGFTGGDGVTVTVKNCSLESVTVKAVYSYALMVGLVNTNDHVVFEGNCSAANSHAVIDETVATSDFPTRKTIKGYTYGVDGTKLWVVGVQDAWAECRTSPTPEKTIGGVNYSVMGDIFYHANGVVVNVCDVAQIGDTKYKSLAAAVAAVPTDGTQTTITMIDDDYYEVNNPITIAKELNVVLDLNGRTVSAVAPSNSASALITNYGTLTINDSGTDGKLLMLANSPDGREIPGYASNTVTNNGKLVVNGGIIQNETTSSNGAACYPIDNVTNGNLYSPEVEINGGQLITKSNAALRLFCNSTTNDNKATINGGYFEAVYYALQIRSSNNCANKGTVVINNGVFEATADSYNCSVVCWNGDSDAVSLTINGGKFNDNIASAAGTNKVYGGLFKCNKYTYPDDGTEYKLADYVAEGYSLVGNTDATTKDKYPWTVTKTN